MVRKMKFKEICRCPCNLLVVIFLDIVISLILYFIIEESINYISLKRVSISLLISISILIAMFFTFKFEREISCIDPLTGVYNRRRLYIDLNKLVKSKSKFELMFIDLNNFKEINDLYGHEAGDKILGKFGEKASNLGSNITCYRMGGDEFVLVANNTNYSIEKLNGFNFSYGTSRFPEDAIGIQNPNDIIDKLLTNADNKMYKRKREIKRA